MAFISSDPLDEYHTALGWFINQYAGLENALFFTLQAVSGLGDPDAQALFSGSRARDIMSFIRRLYEGRNVGLPARVDSAFSHIATITTVRDSILHWGRSLNEGHDEEGFFRVNNHFRAHVERSKRELRISAETLKAMTDDIDDITVVLHHLAHSFSPRVPKPSHPDEQVPWRYRPAPPKP